MSDHCGTAHGYKTHQNRNEPPCKHCLRAVTMPTPTPVVQDRRAAACGTTSGYRRHLRRGETACIACLRASAADTARFKAAKRAGDPTPSRRRDAAICGTTGGYDKHMRDKTKPCDECRTASNKARQERKRRAKAT